MNKIDFKDHIPPKLTSIKGGKEGSIEIKRHTTVCRHWNLIIDIKSRSISCKNCGAIVDPFEHICQWAEEEHKTALNLIGLKHEEKQLETKVEELKAKEKRIKARIYTAKKKEG